MPLTKAVLCCKHEMILSIKSIWLNMNILSDFQIIINTVAGCAEYFKQVP